MKLPEASVADVPADIGVEKNVNVTVELGRKPVPVTDTESPGRMSVTDTETFGRADVVATTCSVGDVV
jgi:hypothetical protein